MSHTRRVVKELESREFAVQVLIRRSDNREGWVAFALELGIVAQGDSLQQVLMEADSACNTFIVDALNDGNDPTEIRCETALFEEAARVRRDGIPMILQRRAYPLIDEEHVGQLLLPMTFQVVRHVAVSPAVSALLDARFEMAL